VSSPDRRHAVGRVGILRPLRHRDFALLWTGLTVSLLGDGIYLVAVAWQVYELSNAPTALSVVGLAWTLPTVLLLLGGGVLSDRFDRRLLMVGADVLRAAAIGTIAVLSLTGVLELWHLLVLVAVYGAGEALFLPSVTAITPVLVPPEELVQANALEHVIRPLATRFLGPALGGALVGLGGAGVGFGVDAASFVISTICVLAIRPRAAPPQPEARPSAIAEVREGLTFVRREPWLWATLCSAGIALLMFWGPLQVLLPFIIKNELHLGAGTFGAVLASGGLGSVVAAFAIGQRGLPRRFVTWMYVAWSFATLELVLYAVADARWQFLAISLLAGGLTTLGNLTWATLLRSRVPSELMGRVSSVDWQVSIALIPLSFALTGPIAQALGAKTTLIAAGVLGTVAPIAFLFVRGVRDPERERVHQASSVSTWG
jgi:DHA3 family tetracycline resistance protein-like MFS transporter